MKLRQDRAHEGDIHHDSSRSSVRRSPKHQRDGQEDSTNLQRGYQRRVSPTISPCGLRDAISSNTVLLLPRVKRHGPHAPHPHCQRRPSEIRERAHPVTTVAQSQVLAFLELKHDPPPTPSRLERASLTAGARVDRGLAAIRQSSMCSA